METNGTPRVLPDLASQQAQELALLREENARLKAKAARQASARVRFKVSEKGAISIYGMGRFPITLYKSQLDALASVWQDLVEFRAEHDAELASKD